MGNAIVQERFDVLQGVSINMDMASLFLMSSALATVDDKPLSDAKLAGRYLKYDLGRTFDPYRQLCTNMYRTRDGRFFHLHGSMNPDASLAMVGMARESAFTTSEDMMEAYAHKVARFDAEWLDVEANEHWRQAGGVCVRADEYAASAQAKAIRDDGLYTLHTFDTDELPAVPYPSVDTGRRRPLEGLRLLDLSRVIATPTIAKLAALFGATVIRVSCPTQPDMGPLLIDGNLGKLDVSLDLKTAHGRATLRRLLDDADMILDGYRPGALERLGFGDAYVRAVARRRGRGIVVVRENCYGWHGPLASRAGWQQISDCVTGVAWAMGDFMGLSEPVVPPLPNSDYQNRPRWHPRRRRQARDPWRQLPCRRLAEPLHPNFAPRHFDHMGTLVGKYMRSARETTAQLFKHAYFDTIESDFHAPDGRLETLTFLSSPATFDVTRLGYDVGSCFPGAYPPEWPR
ncbi:CaiB acyl-CoA transferase carnitine dehydratase [Pyrenophora tritici-repentis]|nr:CAIB/BAIF family enzyme [Pyrenophora tritici-repentis]KAF7449281.1 CAIB/BAIF family enzyme [Pyrenophora tritici-repentis]KAG9383776.1 CAIB/BAIF family enzyme [Pyrenophora tritici-repentis]KAI0570967.1 CAIB/BAIF family enzyme [Pyrenophora tritici-repentis]KAI0573116.1 CAIB/BAIF family enzyme [Pyrenophora tritici-repentis]